MYSPVYNNFTNIALKLQSLEHLYHNVLTVCYNTDVSLYGLGVRTIRSRNYINSSFIKRQSDFSETISIISVFLDFLSGFKLTQDDMRIINNDLNQIGKTSIINAFSPTSDILLFHTIVDPYINWLSDILIQFNSPFIYDDCSISASTNIYRIARRLSMLEYLHWSAITVYPIIPNTSYHVLDMIEVFLKFLSGSLLSDYELDIIHKSNTDFIFSLTLAYDTYILPFDTVVEPYIAWLYTLIDSFKCVYIPPFPI